MRRVVLALVMAACAKPAARPADAGVDLSGLVENDCLSCHAQEMLDQQRLNLKQWTAVVKKMQGWGAPVEPEEVDRLAGYLAARSVSFTAAHLPADEAAAALAPTDDGPFKGGEVAAGAALWDRACKDCHGADGRGSAMGTNLVDRPQLYRAAEFAALVHKGRGRMPQFQVSDTDVANLLAWLRSR